MTNAGIEIERKFILKSIPENLRIEKRSIIEQGYIFSSVDFEIRIRHKGEKYLQTIKQGSGMERIETEIELTFVQFKQLWPLTIDNRIEKERIETNYEGHIIEIDIYSGILDGLLIAEVEFDDNIIAKLFKAPSWFDIEVTYDERYKNKNLALNGLVV